MKIPIATLISDIHFNINTIKLASYSLKAALQKSEKLNIPLIVAGDLNDTKSLIRAEVANSIIEILKNSKVKIYILVGNHDLVNEKVIEHGLNYLRPYAEIIDTPTEISGIFLIPYQNSIDKLKQIISTSHSKKILIMHQGVQGAFMGDYIQDKTSIDPEVFKKNTVISGHYHKHQTVGTVTYIGSPYTITFGEANDGPKGFLILNKDGSFTREILNLRKHVILESDLENINNLDVSNVSSEDLIWLKLKGPQSELQKIKKNEIGKNLFGHSNFKLDLISTNSSSLTIQTRDLPDNEILDLIIDATSESNQQKQYLKELWREIIDS